MKRWLLRALVGLVLLAGLLVAGARLTLPALDGEHTVAGLDDVVGIERDADGIATISGTSRRDVARATGFAHAQDRYFQMDLLRRVAAGELSALVGGGAVEYDRGVRIHGLRRIAQRTYAALPRAQRALLDAYAEGVNAGLDSLTLAPPEYWLLRVRPRRWQPIDSLLVVHAMALALSDANGTREEREQQLRDCLAPEVVDFLVADDANFAATLDGSTFELPPLPPAARYDLRLTRATNPEWRFGPSRSVGESARFDPDLVAMGGSNAWALAGRHTRGGGALVANDMHLTLGVPNTWYRLRLRVAESDIDVSGVSLPGTPAVVAGSNGHVAWGFTNSYGDWTDRVQLRTDAQLRYRDGSEWRRFERRIEIIEVRGGPDVDFSVEVSRFGPVVEDWRGRSVALRWTGHADDAFDLGLLEFERARSVHELLDAATRAGMPQQNVNAGDAAGHVGWTLGGRIPRRDGDEWRGWLAPHEHPRIIDPSGGRIWTANHQVVGGEGLAKIGNGGYWHGARATRIRDVLRSTQDATPARMLALQLDPTALVMDFWHARLVAALDGESLALLPRLAEFREVLAGYRGRADADSAAYRFVRAFRARVRDRVFEPIVAPCRALDSAFEFVGLRQYEGPLRRLVESRPAHLLDPGFESWPALLETSAREVVEHFSRNFDGPLAARTWAEHNVIRMPHPISRAVPALGRFLDMPTRGMPGDRGTPFLLSLGNGASERFAVTPGREAEGYLHMPGGQSGNPFSPFYARGHDAWVRGLPTPFLPGEPRHTLTLRPD